MPDTNTLPGITMPDMPHHNLLKGQKALVTGANSGIGKSVALFLAREGADVVINYVGHEDAAQEVVDTIKQEGGNAIALHADVSNEDQVQAMFRDMLAQFGT